MLVLKVRCITSVEMSSGRVAGCCSAALLTSTSSPPSVSTVLDTACLQNSSSPTSPAIRMQRRPASSTSFFPCSASPCRSEEHTSELQSLMRISYAVFCLKKKMNNTTRCATKYNNYSIPTYEMTPSMM